MSKQPLEPLFKKLDGFIQEGEYQKVIKTSDEILAAAPGDVDALKCKVVAHIKLGQFLQALSILDGDRKVIAELAFEKAYCLYRERRLEDALEIIKGIPHPHPVPVLELEAQIRYRLENYKQSVSIYEELMNQYNVDSSELKTNLCAAYAEAGMHKENQFFVEKNKEDLHETFEFAFNAACSYIAVGDYVNAEFYLNTAKKACSDSLMEDGYTESEVQQELAVMQVQLAYCKQLAGQLDQAYNIYNEVLKSKPADSVAIAVAINNSLVVKTGSDLFGASKKLKDATGEAVEQKLSSSQKRAFNFNKALLNLQVGKGELVRESLQQLEKAGNEEGKILLSASLLVKEKKPEEAEKLLQEYMSKNPRSLQVPLSLAQIYLSKNVLAQVIAVLEGLSEEHKFKPGVVAALAALYEKLGDDEGAIRTVDAYVEWAEKQKDKIDGEVLARILRTNGEFKLKHKKYAQAGEIFERLLKRNRNDMVSLSHLIVAASHYNPELAAKYEDRLPTIENENIDADVLEKLSAPSRPNNQSATTSAPEKDKEKKKKKKRKSRLPKRYDPKAPPDPERWLPKWQRTNYKKRGGKRGLQVGKGGQGVANMSAASFLLAAPKASSPAPTPAASKPAPPHGVQSKNAAKKKKGRK